MKSGKLAVVVAAILVCWSSAALAEETAKPRGPVVVPGIDITGKRQRPLAVVDVGRATIQVKLSELRQPFVERIGKAVEKSPF